MDVREVHMAEQGAALKTAREQARTAYNEVMEVLEEEGFMAGVFEAMAEEQAGAKGKTLEEIRKEHALTH